MVEKLTDRIDARPARGTARHNNAPASFCDGWGLVNEMGKIVAMNFLLNSSEQSEFVHWGSD
jgi:hypothetical protein